MFLAPSRSDLGESLPTTTLLGVSLGEPDGKTPTLIAMVREFPFSGLSSENLDHHMREFEQLCSHFASASMKQDVL
jgi:hypothetical protein